MNKEEILAFEKDVLGIYLSGHPLENYRGIMEKTITARTSDFQPDEETNLPKGNGQSEGYYWWNDYRENYQSIQKIIK